MADEADATVMFSLYVSEVEDWCLWTCIILNVDVCTLQWYKNQKNLLCIRGGPWEITPKPMTLLFIHKLSWSHTYLIQLLLLPTTYSWGMIQWNIFVSALARVVWGLPRPFLKLPFMAPRTASMSMIFLPFIFSSWQTSCTLHFHSYLCLAYILEISYWLGSERKSLKKKITKPVCLVAKMIHSEINPKKCVGAGGERESCA